MKRRKFIRSTGATALSVAALPMEALWNTPLQNRAIRMGIIGTGDRGGGLIPIIESIEGLEVKACADLLPFRLTRAVNKVVGSATSHRDYREILDNPEIDAVLIATPFSTHAKIASEALDAGKHVYCEKTLAKGYEGIIGLLDQANSSKKIFQTGHQYHSSRLFSHIQNEIVKGSIGKISAVNCQWNRNGDWRRPVPDKKYERLINWRMYREFSGGLVAELCSHQLDFVNWFTGQVPESVRGVGGIDYWKDGRETFDNIHLTYKYPEGITANFQCLTSNAKDDFKIKVLGDKGAYIIDYVKAWYYPEKEATEIGELDGVSGATVAWEEGLGIPVEVHHMDPSKQALIDFRDAVFGNVPPDSGITSGAKTAVAVQMGLDALYEDRVVKWPTAIPL